MNKVAELAIAEFHSRNINFLPLYPAILVRVLPKEFISPGGIVLPDNRQNKPLYEGIVLRTYPPHRVKVDDEWILVDSGLEVGDHIIFPHWSGESVPWLPDELCSSSFEEYRLIPARGIVSLGGKDTGEPLLILNYEKENPKMKLYNMFMAAMANEIPLSTVVDDIFKEFDVLIKIKGSMTISGEGENEQ